MMSRYGTGWKIHTWFKYIDTASVFCGKGKVKAFKIPLKIRLYILKLDNFAVNGSLRDDTLNVFQQFSCDLYVYKGDRTITLRCRIYSSKHRSLEAKNIPSCFDSLE